MGVNNILDGHATLYAAHSRSARILGPIGDVDHFGRIYSNGRDKALRVAGRERIALTTAQVIDQTREPRPSIE
jgi:hypothetical protein